MEFYPLVITICYLKMLEQIRKETDQKQREELFNFIGDNGDDRFIEPLSELLITDDSPTMRFSLYTTFTKIGSELAEDIIQNEIRSKLPKDNGKIISKKDWKAAVEFLKQNLEPNFITKVRTIMFTDGKLWALKNKVGVGVYIRNLLRNNGFDWGEKALETYWSWVLEDLLNKTE